MNVVSYCRGATLRRSLRAGGDHRRGRSGRSGIRPSTQRDACPFDTEQAEDFGLQRGFVAQSLDAGKVQDHVVAGWTCGSPGGASARSVLRHPVLLPEAPLCRSRPLQSSARTVADDRGGTGALPDPGPLQVEDGDRPRWSIAPQPMLRFHV
jgi:hypothetical protein